MNKKNLQKEEVKKRLKEVQKKKQETEKNFDIFFEKYKKGNYTFYNGKEI